MHNMEKELKNIGLNEREAKIYFALLKLGEATASKISERSTVERTLTYRILTELIEKGFVSYIVKNNVKYFSASEPESLLKDLEIKEENLKKIIPVLKQIRREQGFETKVEVYRGKEGINTVFRMILKDKKPYYVLGGVEEACTRVRLINEMVTKRLEGGKIPGKIIEREGAEFFIGKNEAYKFISEEFLTSTSTIIWGDKTAIFVWSEPYYVILINNPEIAKSNLSHFNYLWNIAKKPSKSDRERRLLRN